MKRLIILFCMLLAFSFMVLGLDTIGYTGNLYINDTSLTVNATFLRDGQSEALNVTLVMGDKGNWIFGAMANSTGNITPVYSNRINITIYGATHIMPLCSERVPSDPMCNNHTEYNHTFLRDGQTELYTVDVLIDGNIPMPSNWTLSAFVNMSANGTEVNSNSIIIEVRAEIVVPLSVTINNPLNISYTNSTILFDIDSFGDELRDCWYNIGAGIVPYTCNSTFQLTFSEGSYQLGAYANQTNGSEASASVSFAVNTYPLLDLNKPDNSIYSKTNILDFNWTVIDSSNASFACDLWFDNDINTSTNCLNATLCNVQVVNIPDDTYDWKVNCSDGVYSNMSVIRNFTIDTTNPIITIVSPLNSSYNAGLTTNIYTSEISSCFISIDGDSNVSMNSTNNINFTDTISYLDGSHYLVYSCNDTSQNWGTNNVSFFLDITPPIINITNPMNTSYAYTQINISVDTNDAEYCWYSNGSGNISMDYNLEEGKNYSYLFESAILSSNRANCVDGNWDSYCYEAYTGSYYVSYNLTLNYTKQTNNANYTFLIRTYINDITRNYVNYTCWNGVNWEVLVQAVTSTTPTYFTGSIPSSCLEETNLSIKIIDIADPILAGYRNDLYEQNITWINYTSFSSDYIATQGSNIINVGCNDSFGNLGIYNVSFFVDSINPDLYLDSPINQSYNKVTIDINYTATDTNLKDVWYNLNGGANVTLIANTTLTAAQGSNIFNIYANDTLNNLNFTTVSFFVDSLIPVWSDNKTNIPSGNNYNPTQNYAFNITYSDTNFANISFYWEGSKRNTEFTTTASENFTTLGSGNYSFYWIGCDSYGNCNTSDTWVYEIRPHPTTSYAYIDSLRANKTYAYSPSEHTILANWTTNLTALLYFNGISKANGTDMVLGVGTYNITVINEGNSNYTGSNETWWVNVNQASTTTYLFIDTLFANTTKTFGDIINITFYNTNSTLKLYINGTADMNNTANKFNNSLAVGYYNITAFSLNTSNYSSSSSTLWLNITKKGTSMIVTANSIRNDTAVMKQESINFTLTLVDANNTVLVLNVEWWNNFTGTWSKHNTSASPLYNSTNLSGYSTGFYVFGGRWNGNANYTESYENWTMEISDFNLTLGFSCGFPNFTYRNPSPAWIYNYTINLSYTGNYTNGTDLPLIDFEIVRLDLVKVTNATGGERLTFGNYTVSGRTIRVRNESSYKNKLVNVTARYYYTTIVNLTQKRIQPRWQNTTCGIYNLTLESVGSTNNGTLKVKLNNPTNFSSWNITVRLNSNSNYTTAISLNNATYTTLMNMTRGMSYMVWHWLDFNSTYSNKPLNHTIDFHMFTEGS